MKKYLRMIMMKPKIYSLPNWPNLILQSFKPSKKPKTIQEINSKKLKKILFNWISQSYFKGVQTETISVLILKMTKCNFLTNIYKFKIRLIEKIRKILQNLQPDSKKRPQVQVQRIIDLHSFILISKVKVNIAPLMVLALSL